MAAGPGSEPAVSPEADGRRQARGRFRRSAESAAAPDGAGGYRKMRRRLRGRRRRAPSATQVLPP